MRGKKLRRIVGYWNNTIGWVEIQEGLFLLSIGVCLVPVICWNKEDQK